MNYLICRSLGGTVFCVRQDDDARGQKVVFHIPLHSPSGFETGYSGNGPADLALAILADYLQESGRLVLEAAAGRGTSAALAAHQDFKRDFIARFVLGFGEKVLLRGDWIELWLAHRQVLHKQSVESALAQPGKEQT